jgi:universal stress protein E
LQANLTACFEEDDMANRWYKSILVSIESPGERRQPVMQRAAQVALRTGARLTLFHSAFSPYSVGPQYSGSTLEKAVNKTIAGHRRALLALAAPLRARGLKVAVKVAWDYPDFEAIVRETQRTKPDLVVAGSQRRAFGARLFLTNTDWQLIRLCPAPLLFVKKQKAYGKARVLAAVDPLHSAARPAQLDRRILEAGNALATAHGGRLDAVHAYAPMSTYPPIYGVGFAPAFDPSLERQYQQRTQRALERITADYELSERQLHLQPGTPADVLPALARRLRIDVLVMGAVSRRGLQRLLIGSTAERVLDLLSCDVLVVKPRGFKTDVPRRIAAAPSTRGSRASR